MKANTRILLTLSMTAVLLFASVMPAVAATRTARYVVTKRETATTVSYAKSAINWSKSSRIRVTSELGEGFMTYAVTPFYRGTIVFNKADGKTASYAFITPFYNTGIYRKSTTLVGRIYGMTLADVSAAGTGFKNIAVGRQKVSYRIDYLVNGVVVDRVYGTKTVIRSLVFF